MHNLVRFMGVGLLVAGLAACDGNSTDSAAQPARGDTPAQASVPAGQNVSLLEGKVSFTLPAGLSDQSGKLGTQSNNMYVYADKSGQQAIIVITAPTPTPAEGLDVLGGRLVEQQKSRDPSLQVLANKPVELNGAMVQQVNSLQTLKGVTSYSSIVIGKTGDRLLTLQISLPAANQQEAENIANGVLATLKIK